MKKIAYMLILWSVTLVAQIEARSLPSPFEREQAISQALDQLDAFAAPRRVVASKARTLRPPRWPRQGPQKDSRASAVQAALDRAERGRTMRWPSMERVRTFVPFPKNVKSQRLEQQQRRRRRSADFESKPARGHLRLLTGDRRDELNWNIAGTAAGTSPNVLAEYKWPEVKVWETQLKGDLSFGSRYFVDGALALGAVNDGFNEVSEYDGENRTDVATRVRSQSEEGRTMDASIGVGVTFDMLPYQGILDVDQFDVKLMGGYAYHEQKLTMTEGNQLQDSSGGPLGPFDGLDSAYDLEWKGPWIGFELAGSRQRLSSQVRLQYHYFDYYGQGDLNLQPSFEHPKSFEHVADGNGLALNVGLDYQLTPDWLLNLAWNMRKFEVDDGIDRLFIVGGATSETKLNEVELVSRSILMGASYRF